MIDPDDPLDVQVGKQAKIIEALIDRAERAHRVGDSAYALFQSAIGLQTAVWEKTKDLEKALDTLGRTSNALDLAQREREQVQRYLADAMDAMEGGFALFSQNRLLVCNTLFRQVLPDVEPLIAPGLAFDDYLTAVNASKALAQPVDPPLDQRTVSDVGTLGPFVMALKSDRWFQVSCRRTSADNFAVQQTEITDIVHGNRRERKHLIDRHALLLQAAFDHLPLGVCMFSADGDLLARNDRFGALLHIPLTLLAKGTALGRIIDHVNRHEVLERPRHRLDLARWQRDIHRGSAVQEQLRRRDGISLDFQIHPLPDEGYIVSVRDVTAEAVDADARQRANEMLEQRVSERTAELTEMNARLRRQAAEQARTEDALRLAKEAAEAADHSKTRFLAAASHDLLQPINAAKLYISTLSETVSGLAATQTVDRLSRSFASIESLLHALLDISRLDSPAAEFNVGPFDLQDLMETIREDMSPLAAEKGLDLRVVPTTHRAVSDQRYIQRCIRNLVVNAIQYTETGKVLVGCRRVGDQVRVEVRDTGVGISPEEQTRVFKEFTRLGNRGSGSGMGLGLSIVERACRHLGHAVRLESEPGKGSLFSIELPLAARFSLPTMGGRLREAAPDTLLNLIVMMVENDADVLHATTQNLETWGASVLAAGSTEAALKLMADIGTPPDILLADYHLDGSDTGIDTVRALRALAATEIPAIMITADRSKALLRLGAELSFSVLTKPVQPARLRALIDWKTRAAGQSSAKGPR